MSEIEIKKEEGAQIHFKKGLAVSIKVIQGDPADEIVKLASDEKAGLIVMSTRGSSGRAPYMAGSVAVKIAGMAPLSGDGRPWNLR